MDAKLYKKISVKIVVVLIMRGIRQPHLPYLPKRPVKTYNSQDSHVVTHYTTNWPASGLSTAELTGSPVL